MLNKALQVYSPTPGYKKPSLSQQSKGTANTLRPSASAVLNASRPSWPSVDHTSKRTANNPLKRTASQANGGESFFGRYESVTSRGSITNMSQASGAGGRVGKLHQTVFFDENDFEDDADINLDGEASSLSSKSANSADVSYPTLSNEKSSPSLVSYPTLPLPTSHLEPKLEPPSSMPLPWSSSPMQHKLPPPKLLAPPIHTAMKTKTRKKLPWLLDEKEVDKSSCKAASVDQSIERRRAQDTKVHGNDDLPNMEGSTFTPLPKDNPKLNSPYPWNTTASAVKEEQKKLRQGYKKLVKDNGVTEKMTGPQNSRMKDVARFFLSDEQKKVLNLVADEKRSVFFTGSAGTGKSVLLREIIKVLREKHKREPDRVAVTASTGLAACNVGGVTLHSFGGIGLGKEAVPELVRKIRRNQKAKNRWMRTKVLIVDEISMVDGDLFDKLEGIARIIRNNGRPFGGIQLVITGDFFQLPPVPDYGKISKFSFDAATWNTSIEHTIGLTQVFRQKDPVFANMLNEMRLGRLTQKSIDAFRALSRPLDFQDNFEATELFPTRQEVDNANNNRMRNLVGKAMEFRAEDGGMIIDHAQRDKLLSNCMAPPLLTLKKGSQVMLIKNTDDMLVNGSVGKVIAFMDEKTFDYYDHNEDEFQTAKMMNLNDEETTESRKKLKQMINKDLTASTSQVWPLVRFAVSPGVTRDLLCQRDSWKIELPNGEVQASRSQVPLILAWALSIHKAQGQTLERVKVDLGKIFEKGQAYVALSRATCQEGLQISRFDPKKVMAHDKVRSFYDSLYNFDHGTAPSSVVAPRSKKAEETRNYTQSFMQGGDLSDEDNDALQEIFR